MSVYLAIALLAGAGLTVQAGANSRLRQYVGDPSRAALVSFAVGTVVLLIYSLAARAPWPAVSTLTRAPWWVWIGGLLGSFYVFVSVIAAPRLGAAVLFGLIVAGQVLCSLVLDQFGLVGYARHAITPGRVLGAALVLVGVALVRRF